MVNYTYSYTLIKHIPNGLEFHRLRAVDDTDVVRHI